MSEAGWPDDAGGGRRGTRPQLSSELMRIFTQQYGLGPARPDADLGGSSNLNVLVTDGEELFVARVYRHHMTAVRLAAIQAARRVLADGGVPASVAVPTRAGKPWTLIGENLIEVERFVASDAKMDDCPRFEAGLRVLGRAHNLLAGVEVAGQAGLADFANYLPADAALTGTHRGTARIRAWGASGGELRLAGAADRLAERVAAEGATAAADLHRQLVHGDFWDNNVLFRDGAVVLVTDLDFMGVRPRVDDLALPLYYSGLFFLKRRGADGGAPIHELRRLVDAYDSGLEHRLSEAERAALPLAICRQPLWSFGIWIADLDDERAARAHAAELQPAVDWTLSVAMDLERWQAAFV